MVGWDNVIDFEVADPRAGWSMPHMSLKSFDRFRFTLDGNFHTAVRQVPHPPVQSLARGGCLSVKAKADSLNAAA